MANMDVSANPSVFINQRALNHRAFADADIRQPAIFVDRQFMLVFIKIRPHDNRGMNRDLRLHDAPQAHHRIGDFRVMQAAAVRQNHVFQRRAIHFARRQKAGMRVNRMLRIIEIEWAVRIDQIQIDFVIAANRADVRPIPVKDVPHDAIIRNRARRDVFG